MKCPNCSSLNGKVLDTRTHSGGYAIKRRRQCMDCNERFTTFEAIEASPILIVKKNGLRQTFDKSKIMVGLLRACEKRPIDVRIIEDMADKIEQNLNITKEKEIPSSLIGTLIMERLKEVDIIAYVRFVSVYKEFNDIDSFIVELQTLISKD